MSNAAVGLALMVCGVLIAALCGQCTFATRMYWPISLVVGGIPTLVGVAAFVMGFRMWWNERQGRR